jgi:dinuclear metal center YbgI/SA1388 family protein
MSGVVKMTNVLQIMEIVDSIAPQYLKLGYDKVGLQVGSRSAPVKRILVTLEITDAVVEEAREKRTDLIISHHPLIFKSLDRVVEDDFTGSVVTSLIRSCISVLVAHTNLDRASNGVNKVLAYALGLQDIEVLQPVTDVKMFKVVVFAPGENVEQIIRALGEVGAGLIGNYSFCTYRSEGTGTFLPNESATPRFGSAGELNQVHESRLEMLVAPDKLDSVIDTMIKVHPYEEVAYDVYEVLNPQAGVGMGRLGNLPKPEKLGTCVEIWQKKLGCTFRVAGDFEKLVKRVAVCGGSGADLIGIAKARGADVLITGDVKHHSAHEALEKDIAIIDAGHADTERLVVPELVDMLQVALREQGLDIGVQVSGVDTSPWNKV